MLYFGFFLQKTLGTRKNLFYRLLDGLYVIQR